MALKDNIKAIKKEIGVEEQFLESMIKSEHFYKRYKKQIIAFAVVLFLGIGTYITLSVISENRLQASNDAFSKLLKDPNDAISIVILRESNERLYNFFRLQEAIKIDDIATFKELAQLENDPVISDLATFQLYSLEGKSGSKSELLSDFVALKEGYKLLKEHRFEEARLKFAQISLGSPLKNISNNLEHYQGIEYKGSN